MGPNRADGTTNKQSRFLTRLSHQHDANTKRSKAEKTRGGSGWESQRWYQDLLERASVSIARSDHEMLRNNRSLPRA